MPPLPAAWLLSSAGRRGALVRLLRENPIEGPEARVVATDRSPLSAAGLMADRFETVPGVVDPDFVTQVLELAVRNNVRIIIPTIDPEIAVYAENREAFLKEGIDVWVSSPEVAQLGWDKWDLYIWLRKNGFPTVRTGELLNLDDRWPRGPLVAKPRNGSSGIGVVYSDSASDIAKKALDSNYIVQEKAPGFEVTVDFAVGQFGRVLGIVPRRRLETRGGEVSKGVTVDYPMVIELVRELASSLPGAYGALNVQVFYDPGTSTVNIIEINPRFGGGYPLTHMAGANFLDAILRDRRGDLESELTWSPGTLMLRYDDHVISRGFDYRGLDE